MKYTATVALKTWKKPSEYDIASCMMSWFEQERSRSRRMGLQGLRVNLRFEQLESGLPNTFPELVFTGDACHDTDESLCRALFESLAQYLRMQQNAAHEPIPIEFEFA